MLHQYFKFDVIRCAGYAVITEKPRVGQLGRIFRAPCMKNCVGAKNERCQFSMGTTTSITVQSLEKIVQRAPAVAAKMWCLSPAGLPQSVKHRGIKFTQGQKSSYSPFTGDSLHRCMSNFGAPTSTRVRLAVQNISSIGAKIIKNFHFLVRSRLARANPFIDLLLNF